MSYVSTALTSALEALGWTQIALADKADVDRAMVNRYSNGAVLGPENLLKLTAVLPPPHDTELTIAYLRDALPPSLACLVSILSQSPLVQEENPMRAQLAEALDALDEPLRRDTLYLLQRAGRLKPIADLITSIVSVLRGDRSR